MSYDDARKILPRISTEIQKALSGGVRFAVVIWEVDGARTAWAHDLADEELLAKVIRRTADTIEAYEERRNMH